MALLFTLILGTAAAILGYTGYYLNKNHFIIGIEEILDTEYSYLNALPDHHSLIKTLNYRLKDKNRVYLLSDQNGHKILGNLSQIPEKTKSVKDGLIFFHPNGHSGIYAAKIYSISSGEGIFIGTNMSDLLATERVILWMCAATILPMMLVVIASYLISTFVVSRTNHIAQTAQDIMTTGDLSRRIAIDSRWDDLSNMAYVLNSLLARIEDLMLGVRRVADNIAHDLRTPLTRLRNGLEDINKGQLYSQQQMQNIIKDADHMLSTFQAVLRISKIENAPSHEHFRPYDLSILLNDVMELYEPISTNKNIKMNASLLVGAPYEGDIDLLFQMFANILDNAIKFTPTGGQINIGLLTLHNGQYQIDIDDSGIGIAENDLQYVFDRFFRGEKSRSTDGNGLGLSMVMAVINLHHGQISLKNLDQGLRVSIIL